MQDCSEIRVGSGQGNFEPAKLVAKDIANDLALLKVDYKPKAVGAFRFGVRLGENVEAFGYPLVRSWRQVEILPLETLLPLRG